jgi:hypothetical protein
MYLMIRMISNSSGTIGISNSHYNNLDEFHVQKLREKEFIFWFSSEKTDKCI